MIASLVRISLLLGISAAAWFFYPKYKPIIQPILANPTILGKETLEPAITKINDLLPDNFQIPVTKDRPSEASIEGGNDQNVLGSSNDQTNTTPSNSTNLSTITNSVIDQVKQKAAEAAQDQIDAIKKETGNAFCAALVETIKKQCGLPN